MRDKEDEMRKDYFFSAIALSLVLSMLVVDPVRATTSTDLQQKQNKLEQEEQALKNQKKENFIKYGILTLKIMLGQVINLSL